MCYSDHHGRLRIGAGIAIALIIGTYVAIMHWQEFSTGGTTRAQSTPAVSGNVPEVSTLLDYRDELRLTDQQCEKIKKIQSEWERTTADIKEKQNRIFQKQLEEAEKKGVNPKRLIEQRGMGVGSVAAQIDQKRRAVWDRAMKLLSSEQREIVDKRMVEQRSIGK
jgi:dihydropteroate synthase